MGGVSGKANTYIVEKGKQVVACGSGYVGATDHPDSFLGKTGGYGETVNETASDVCIDLG